MKTARILPALLAAALLAGCDTVQSVAVTHRMVHQQDLMRDVPARIAAMPPAADRTFALASPFSDHMVLQRDMPVPVWGTGTPGAEVEVALFSGNGEERRRVARRTATVGENARWVVLLPSLSAGGPYALDAVERSLARPGEAAPDGARLALEDILVGDVWLCGGQSNMEMNFNWGVKDGDKELADADLPQVRLLHVERAIDIEPRDAVSGTWTPCNAETARGFSACGFFFGRKLQREIGVPVGLVEDCWSGTIAETWLSIEGAAAVPGLEKAVAERRRVIAEWKDGGPEKFRARHDAWRKSIDPVGEAAAAQDFAEGEGWADDAMPFSFERSVGGGFDGVVWARRDFDLTAEQAAAPDAVLALGLIDDSDDAFLNGTKVGHTDGWQAVRRYRVPAGVLREGRNTLAIRMLDTGGNGGFHGADRDVPRLEFGDAAPAISLAGEGWRRLAGPSLAENPEPKDPTKPGAFPNVPAACFNGMLSPLFPMAVRGAIWYQGCSNVGRAEQYKTLLPAVIGEWRNGFTSADGLFPFYIVQLAAYRDTHEQPVESGWAAMRWAQTQIGLSVTNGGTAVAIDVGDHGDIHPKNKRAVGDRLAALALAQTYGRTDQKLSPVPKFDEYEGLGTVFYGAACHWCGSGATSVHLVDPVSGAPAKLRPGEVKGFEVSADGKTWHRTKASVPEKEPNCVIVDAHVLNGAPGSETPARPLDDLLPSMKGPVAIRYAWDDYPDCDLVSADGLPVGPFEIPVGRAR